MSDYTRTQKQDAAATQLQAQFPEMFEVIEGETYRIVEVFNPLFEIEADEVDYEAIADEHVDAERRPIEELGCYRNPENREGFYVELAHSPYRIDDGEDVRYGSKVYARLMRVGYGRQRGVYVPREFSNKLDDNNRKKADPAIGNVFFAGHQFEGDERDKETGYKVMIRYTATGVYLSRGAKNYMAHLKDNQGSLSEMATWQDAAIYYALNGGKM